MKDIETEQGREMWMGEGGCMYGGGGGGGGGLCGGKEKLEEDVND